MLLSGSVSKGKAVELCEEMLMQQPRFAHPTEALVKDLCSLIIAGSPRVSACASRLVRRILQADEEWAHLYVLPLGAVALPQVVKLSALSLNNRIVIYNTASKSRVKN